MCDWAHMYPDQCHVCVPSQPDALVESCLDLLCKLVRPGHREVAAAVAAACAEPLLRLLLPASAGGAASPPDSGVAQGATELLVELVGATAATSGRRYRSSHTC